MNEQVFHIGVKGLIRNKKGQLLLLTIPSNRLLDKSLNNWDIPGGRMNPGETFEDTLAREIHEEIGVVYDTKPELIGGTLTKFHIPTDRGEVALVLMLHLLTIPDDTEIVLSHEHDSYEWVDPETAIERLKNKYQDDFAEQIRASLGGVK